jgi:heat shock protein HslJ
MKKIFMVFPLAVMLANCSSSHNSTSTSSSKGVSVSGAAGTSGNATMSSNAGAGIASATSVNDSPVDLKSYIPDRASGYDPNNYSQNPEKYIPSYMLARTGGYTYNVDWQRNKNFSKEAEGTWQLVLTPEVSSSWIKDTSRPETYASYWTPEAVALRQEALMMAAAKTADSLRVLDSIATIASAPLKSGKNKSGKYARLKRKPMGVQGSAAAGSSSTGDASVSASVAGSGTTGQMGTGGMAATPNTAATATTGSDTSANSSSVLDASGAVSSAALTAVNGNNFMLPTINLPLGIGSFTAYTGCNDAIGTLTMDGNKLHFTQTSPLNNIQCIGGFDQAGFIDRLSRADSYDVVNNQIRFKQGEQVLMVFAKSAQQ